MKQVACTVNLAVVPRAGSTKDSAKEELPFEVKPKKLNIAPQEFAFVTITYNPTKIQVYSALFEAIVAGSIDPKSNKLSFELRGEATLPQVVVQVPTFKNKQGIPTLKFKKLLLGRVQSMQIVLHNDGIIPATVKV